MQMKTFVRANQLVWVAEASGDADWQAENFDSPCSEEHLMQTNSSSSHSMGCDVWRLIPVQTARCEIEKTPVGLNSLKI